MEFKEDDSCWHTEIIFLRLPNFFRMSFTKGIDPEHLIPIQGDHVYLLPLKSPKPIYKSIKVDIISLWNLY